MPKYCRAPHCSNAAGQARPPARRLSFYKFPLHDAPRLRRWLAQMRRENWVPTRHQHLCSDHFEPSCFQYRWGVRYLRPDAVPTIFPRSPLKQENPSTAPGATRPPQPLPASGPAPVTPAQPLTPKTATPTPGSALTAPGDVPGAAASPANVAAAFPVASKGVPSQLSTEELVAVALVLQRKVKVLQQRRRRHRARLAAMEGLLQRLRRQSRLSEERLRSACLQPATPAPAVTIICQEEEEEEEEEEELVYAVPQSTATTCGPERP